MTSPPYDGLSLYGINARSAESGVPAGERPRPAPRRAAYRRALTAWRRRAARRRRDTPMHASSIQETTNQKNLLLLITLRWVAVVGQISTIAVTVLGLKIALPVAPMACVVLALAAVNIVSFYRAASGVVVSNAELLAQLLIDVGALTLQLYLTGGVTNPFISLFLVQIILGAVLLPPAQTWALAGITTACFSLLVARYQEIGLFDRVVNPTPGRPDMLELHRWGMLICFLLAAAIEVWFVTRINRNLRLRDARLAELRQQSTEESHIIRMGLLASGAAHELGSPLATLSVIVSDWGKMPALTADRELSVELGEMQGALARCKEIVSRMLLSVGETRAENAERTTLVRFCDEIVETWRKDRNPTRLDYINRIRVDVDIVADAMITQALVNVFDNALEASPAWVGIEVTLRGDQVSVRVHDKGPGFTADILARFGKPYASTKERPGRGMGLFLVTNVLRKLGGSVVGKNNPDGGATVTVRFPVGVLSLGAPDAGV